MSAGQHLFLVGFMGAGKSTVARLVSQQTERPCIDLDALIEHRAQMPVAEIFTLNGEDDFRFRETDALLSLESEPASVVACGGGVVVRAENRSALKRLGVVVYLRVTAGEAIARIGDAQSRPLLSGPSGTLAATSLLAARESLYCSVADVVVDTVGKSPEQVATEVIAFLEDDR